MTRKPIFAKLAAEIRLDEIVSEIMDGSNLKGIAEAWLDKLIMDTAFGKLTWDRPTLNSQARVAYLRILYSAEIRPYAGAYEIHFRRHTPNQVESLIYEVIRERGTKYDKAMHL